MPDVLTRWIAAYRRAWESNEPDDIRALFTDDAEYRTEPWAEPWVGVEQIVTEWLEAKDEPGETTFVWAPLVVTDELSIAQLRIAYREGSTYSNLWVIRFAADGRATSFTEWWMEHPPES